MAQAEQQALPQGQQQAVAQAVMAGVVAEELLAHKLQTQAEKGLKKAFYKEAEGH